MPAGVVVATIMRPEGDTGVQTHFQTYLAWLRAGGRAAELVTPYAAPRWLVYPIFALRRLIHPLSRGASVRWYRHWHRVFVERALRIALSAGGPCVVYAQCPLSADAALRARRNPEQKVVMVVHFNVSQADEWASKGWIMSRGPVAESIRRFEAKVLPSLDGLVFVSDFMRGVLHERIPAIASVPTCVVPNFVPDPGEPRHAVIDADLLTVGTLEPRKNQLYALQIVAAAKAEGRQLSLTIAGDGPDRAMLESSARRLGVESQVRFLGMVRNGASLFERHRACLHVARIENFPITLVEALARGVPVFATPVGGVPEVFVDGVEGRYLPMDEALRSQALISAWLRDDATMSRAGADARRRFVSSFQSDVAAAALTSFLDRVAHSDACDRCPDPMGMDLPVTRRHTVSTANTGVATGSDPDGRR